MRAKTICLIRQMLISEKAQALKKYKDFQNHLIHKYETDHFDLEMNKEEKEILNKTYQYYLDTEEALKDFEEYHW